MLLVEQRVEVVDVGERVDVGLRELMAVVVVDLH